MKPLFVLAGVLALAAPIAQAGDSELFHLVVKDVPVENGKVLDMEFHEIERNAEASTVQITRRSGGSVSSSMFILRGMCGLARARGAQNFTPVRIAGEEKERFTVSFSQDPPDAGKGFTMAQCALLRY